MSDMSTFQQKEKIIEMKLQTAKILWRANRKEATFLLLESLDDPRADELRDRMGFDDDFEVGETRQDSVSQVVMGIVAVVLIGLSFLLGTFLNLNGRAVETNPVITENELIATPIIPTPKPGEPITQPLVEQTGAASQVQLTQVAIENEQRSSMSLLDATETARYAQATATENARETQATGG